MLTWNGGASAVVSTGVREDIRHALAAGVPYGGTPQEPSAKPRPICWNSEWYRLARLAALARRTHDKRFYRAIITGMANARYMLRREREARRAAA